MASVEVDTGIAACRRSIPPRGASKEGIQRLPDQDPTRSQEKTEGHSTPTPRARGETSEESGGFECPGLNRRSGGSLDEPPQTLRDLYLSSS